MVEYRCPCGRVYPLANEMAGKKVRCPACGSSGYVGALFVTDQREVDSPVGGSGAFGSKTPRLRLRRRLLLACGALLRVRKRTAACVLVAVIILLAVLWIANGATDPTRRPPVKGRSAPTAKLTPQALPENGAVEELSVRERVAPFRITTGAGGHYLVKLVDASLRSDVLTVFVHAGSIAEVKAPLGRYELRYACGREWYGYQHLFGPPTTVGKADRLLEFSQAADGIRGVDISLRKAVHGNLRTRSMSRAQF